MKNYLAYDSTGKITRQIVWGDDINTIGLISGESVVQGSANDAIEYIPDINTPDIVADKLPNPISIDKTTITADGVDFITVSNMAPGGNLLVFLGGTFEIALTIPYSGLDEQITITNIGEYRLVELSAPSYQQFEVTIHAV